MFFFRRFIIASFLSLHFLELTFLSKDYIFAPQTRSHSEYRYVTNLKKKPKQNHKGLLLYRKYKTHLLQGGYQKSQ